MKQLLLGVLMVLAQPVSADFLSDNLGYWEGKGVLASGFEWPIYVNFKSGRAEVNTPDDGCEAIWHYGEVTHGMIRGWEEVTVGADRCYVGLEFVVTRYDEHRLEVNWYKPNGMFVAEAVLWPIQ